MSTTARAARRYEFLTIDGDDTSEAGLGHAVAAVESPSRAVRTLFVDDIPSLPVDRQRRLLAATSAARGDRLRVVLSLPHPLQHACDAGSIALELVARLAPVEIAIPPLRERRSDIPVLVEYFLKLYADRHSLRRCRVDREALVHLWGHDWPGNVRELESVIERLAVVRHSAARSGSGICRSRGQSEARAHPAFLVPITRPSEYGGPSLRAAL